MGKKKYKSIFILYVYQHDPFDTPKYRISKEKIKWKGDAKPGFNICESDMGIFESLEQAEKAIKRIAKNDNQFLYSFLVEEMPVGGTFYTGQALSRRRYLKDGKLWQKSAASEIRHFNGDIVELGDTGFYGRDLENIPFKEGDVVEVADRDFVHLAIIWKLPPSIERMREIWKGNKAFRQKMAPYPDESEDVYTTVFYTVGKNGEIIPDIMNFAVVDVLPASLPVPRRTAAELRRRLKKIKDDCERYWIDHPGDIPF
jgi:hypothetical protein